MAIGIRYQVTRDSDEGQIEKIIFVPTHPAHEHREACSKHKRAYNKASFAMQRLEHQIVSHQRKLNGMGVMDERYDDQVDKVDALIGKCEEAEHTVNATAEKIVRLCLARNYGKEEVDDILSWCSQQDILGMLIVINNGALPKDFFPSSEPRPKPTSTEPSGDGPVESSSDRGSPSDK